MLLFLVSLEEYKNIGVSGSQLHEFISSTLVHGSSLCGACLAGRLRSTGSGFSGRLLPEPFPHSTSMLVRQWIHFRVSSAKAFGTLTHFRREGGHGLGLGDDSGNASFFFASLCSTADSCSCVRLRRLWRSPALGQCCRRARDCATTGDVPDSVVGGAAVCRLSTFRRLPCCGGEADPHGPGRFLSVSDVWMQQVPRGARST